MKNTSETIKGFKINHIAETVHITYTNKLTTKYLQGKPPPLILWKTPLKPSTVSLESPKAPSRISSAVKLETLLTKPLKSPKNPHRPQLFSEHYFCRDLSLMKGHI